MDRRIASLTVLAALGALSAPLAGCRGDRSDDPPRQFFPGLDDQPKYKVQAHSKFFADGRTMREPVAGTVAFGRASGLSYGATTEDASFARADIARERADLLREDRALYEGVNADGSVLDRIPIRAALGLSEGEAIDEGAMRRFIEKGRERFNIFCIVCHGGTAMGDGNVGKVWSTVPANLQDPKFHRGGEFGQDGHIFQVIRNGKPNVAGALPAFLMPSYGAQIDEREAWEIVAYLRALQASRQGSLDSVPEGERGELLRRKPPPTPAPEAPAATPAAPAAEKGAAP